VRGRLSTSYWKAVSEMQRQLQEKLARREEPRVVLDRLLLSLAALSGFALDDMTQDAGWRLLRIGRRIERLQFIAELLALHLESDLANHPSQIEWLLEAYDSIRVYRSRYAVAPRLGPMLDLLMRDEDHPRALAFLTKVIAADLAYLARTLVNDSMADEGVGLVGELTDEQLLTLEREGPEAEEERQSLAGRLRALSAAAGQLSDRLSLRHFSHISLDSQSLAT
jgi:uncharacterized alpha-E superfamily protein